MTGPISAIRSGKMYQNFKILFHDTLRRLLLSLHTGLLIFLLKCNQNPTFFHPLSGEGDYFLSHLSEIQLLN